MHTKNNQLCTMHMAITESDQMYLLERIRWTNNQHFPFVNVAFINQTSWKSLNRILVQLWNGIKNKIQSNQMSKFGTGFHLRQMICRTMFRLRFIMFWLKNWNYLFTFHFITKQACTHCVAFYLKKKSRFIELHAQKVGTKIGLICVCPFDHFTPDILERKMQSKHS